MDATIACAAREAVARARSGGVLVQARLFAPDTGLIRFAVVLAESGGLGHTAFATGFWRGMCLRHQCGLVHFLIDAGVEPATVETDPGRNARVGTGVALEAVLDSLAQSSGRPELSTVPLIAWGFSASGSLATTLAEWNPKRIVGFVRYHSHLRGLAVDTAALARVPALLIAGEQDYPGTVADNRALFAAARSRGAPWAFLLENGPDHFSLDNWLRSSELVWRWVNGLRQGATPFAVQPGAEWLGDADGSITAARTHRRDRAATSWFPDSASAAAWQRLSQPRPR